MIGAGMVGICSALWLQRRGYSVVVVDPNPPGSGASYGNAGCFSPTSIIPTSTPGILWDVPSYLFDPLGPLSIRWRYLPTVFPWLMKFIRAGRSQAVERQVHALHSLLSPLFENLDPLLKEAGAEQLVHRTGHIYLFRTEEGFASAAKGWEMRRRYGAKYSVLRNSEIADFDPALSPDYHCAILIESNGHTIDPFDLVNALASSFLGRGGSIVRNRAISFNLADNRLRGVIMQDGSLLRCEAAVVAAGAFSKPLAAQLGDDVPLETERGYHLVIRRPDVMPRVATTDAERKYVATPMRDGLRMAGTVELAGLAAPPNWRRANVLLDHARSMMPALRKDYPQSQLLTWMGFRPSFPDSLPLIDRSRACPAVVYAFGHGHVGMSGSPMTGRLVADLIAGDEPAIDLKPFSARRFRGGVSVEGPSESSVAA